MTFINIYSFLKKPYLKLSIIIILSLCIFGLIIFNIFYFLDKANNYNLVASNNKIGLEDSVNYMADDFKKLPDNFDMKKPIRFLFFGDMMLDRHVGVKIKQNGLGYIFDKLDEANFYDNYNLVSANLEGAVTDNGAHYSPVKAFDFAFSPEIINELKKYNFNFFNLANNHFEDQGIRGVNETRKNLEELGFDYVGCGNGIVDECSGKIIYLDDKKIGMIGLSVLGVKIDLEAIKKIINEFKKETDLIIINIHWGEEYAIKFNNFQQKTAYDFIDVGVDLIIGHHPHVVQGIEVYKNKPIFYSLGNFVFDQYFSEETQKGLAIEFILNDNQLNFKIHPLKSEKSQVSLMTDKDKRDFLQNLIKRSSLNEEIVEQISDGGFILERYLIKVENYKN
jgi:gamma-polyglutamate biosynthesis protein CapA